MTLPELSSFQWFALLGAGFFMGMSKAGVKGMGMLIVPVLAIAFGGKNSTGLLLPILSMADILAVRYYNRHANWKYVIRLMPSAMVGVILGVWIGSYINDDLFQLIMAIIVLGSLGLLIWQEKAKPSDEWTEHPITAVIAGLLGGFTTMVGNVAGAIMAVYLLAVKLPKNSFIGTVAWFFLIINLFKFPFHYFVWETITPASLRLDLFAIPAILVGFLLGVKIVGLIPEKSFRYFIMIMTAIAAIRLLA